MGETTQESMRIRKLENGNFKMALPKNAIYLEWTPEQAVEFGAKLCAMAGKRVIFVTEPESNDG